MKIADMIKNSDSILYAACVGKTSLSKTHNDYKTTVQMAEILVDQKVGIIHGGYEDGKGGGTMQAYAKGANNIIQKKGLHKNYNIGVPEERFDKKRGIESRTGYNTSFSKPLSHIDDRCGTMIDNCDFMVVNQNAGNGTMREVFTMYERNDIHKPNNLGIGKIKPIIFYGSNWKELFMLIENEFTPGTLPSKDNNLYFVNSLEEFKLATKKIIKNNQ